MIFKSKIELFFWLACFVAANICIIISVLSIGNVPAAVWGIIIGCNVFFSVFVITQKYILNRKYLKKYSEAIKGLRKKGIIITALKLDKMFISGFWFDEKGQVVRIDSNGYVMPLSFGHRIIIDRKGYPIEFDEYGRTIKEPAKKHLSLVIFMSVIGTIVVLGGFVALFMFLPWVGVPLFILFSRTLYYVTRHITLHITRHKTRHKTPNSYIEHQKKWIRPQLKKAHEAIMQIYGEDIQCFVGDQRYFLHYYVMREGKPYVFIEMQATVLPYKGICLYPGKGEALAAFANRLRNNKTLGHEIFFSSRESINYYLIRDIASFCLGVE